jgi:hypothetical protein
MVRGNALHYLGEATYLKGDLQTAQTLHEEEADLTWRTVGEDDLGAIGALGIVAYARRDFPSARTHLRKALSHLHKMSELYTGELWWQRRVLWGLGLVLAREESPAQAAVLIAAVEAATHIPRRLFIDQEHEPAEHRRCVALIESALTPEELRQAQQHGAAMTLDQATDYALTLFANTAAE